MYILIRLISGLKLTKLRFQSSVSVYTGYILEQARHDPPLFIEAFASRCPVINGAYNVGRANNEGLLQD